MSLSREVTSLIEFAQSIELYAHTNRVVVRLEMGDYEAALVQCRHAVAQCSELIMEQPPGPQRKKHMLQYRNIRLLEAMIAASRLSEEREMQATLF